jgi:hypothetical protein
MGSGLIANSARPRAVYSSLPDGPRRRYRDVTHQPQPYVSLVGAARVSIPAFWDCFQKVHVSPSPFRLISRTR